MQGSTERHEDSSLPTAIKESNVEYQVPTTHHLHPTSSHADPSPSNADPSYTDPFSSHTDPYPSHAYYSPSLSSTGLSSLSG